MPDSKKHLNDTIQDYLDRRLGPEEQKSAESHLQECTECQAKLDALRWTKDRLTHVATVEMPAGLENKLRQSLDQEDTKKKARRMLVYAVAAVLLLALAAFVFLRADRRELPETMAKDYDGVERQQLSLDMRTNEEDAMENFFKAQGIPFRTRVFDLAMMQYDLLGGRVHRVDGKQSALFVYSGPGKQILVCQMFPAPAEALPPTEVMPQNNGITFYLYQYQGVTVVLWREGDVLCALSSRQDPQTVLQLAFAKAVKP